MSIFDILKKEKNKTENETSCLPKCANMEIKTAITALKKNGIVMNADEHLETNPNSSKIGGKPFLPTDFEWPTFTSKEDNITRPLSFFCQLNLAELNSYDKDNVLPEQGMLSFFYECESFCWGFDPEDKGAARVFFFEDLNGFIQFDIPKDLNEEYIIPELGVRFDTVESYPLFEEFDVLNNTEYDWDEYDSVLAELGVDVEEDFEEHKILGYADLIQSEMLTECERATRDMYCGDPESYQNTPNDVKADVNEKAKEWILLLQLGTIEKDDFQWMFGDCGMLYYYIKKEDLAERRFDNMWFSVQCY